jgi:hypothetical protein
MPASRGGLMDGIGSRGGTSHRRTLPQLSRFGTDVAQELHKRGINVLGVCNFKQLGVAEMAHPTTVARLICRSMFSDMA